MTQTAPLLKKTTDLQAERASRDLAIFNEYNALVAVEGQSRTEVNKYLMRKYDLHSTGTVYTIIKRVKERINHQKQEAV